MFTDFNQILDDTVLLLVFEVFALIVVPIFGTIFTYSVFCTQPEIFGYYPFMAFPGSFHFVHYCKPMPNLLKRKLACAEFCSHVKHVRLLRK